MRMGLLSVKAVLFLGRIIWLSCCGNFYKRKAEDDDEG
jgi:hypothetical protein